MVGAAALTCLGIPVALGAGDTTPRGVGVSGIDVEIVETSQERLLAKEKLKVSVTSINEGRANLGARSRTSKGRRHRIAEGKVVRVGQELKTFHLKLTDSGLRRLARCKP